MTTQTRSLLTLAGFIAVISVSGGVALSAMTTYGGPALRVAKVTVQLDESVPDGSLRLRTLETVRLGDAVNEAVVPAGTTVTATAAVLSATSTVSAGGLVAGTTLRCELRMRTVGTETKTPLVDVANCVSGHTDEQP